MPKPDRPKPAPADPRPARTWLRDLGLVLATVFLLSLTYAPVGQFYLAWVGLVPWMVLVATARTKKAVFFWSWLTGYLYFVVNMFWLGNVTVPGLLGLMLYMGIWFPFVALVIRGARLLPRTPTELVPWVSPFGIAAVWVAAEWCWGNLMTGLPWLFVGHSQTPLLAMCQVADVTGVYGVSFWVVLINAVVAGLVLRRFDWRPLLPAGIGVVVLLVAIAIYGSVRMNESAQFAGPTVMVVQPSFPQDPTGAKGATYEEILLFHLKETRAALERLAPAARPDLVVWSETMMPPPLPGYRPFWEPVEQLATEFNATFAVGATTLVPPRSKGERGQRYNSVLVIPPSGRILAEQYHKIHLVPFGEFTPFRNSFPPLYRFFKMFDPNQSEYEVTPGEQLTVFPLSGRDGGSWRFVTPICFEDVDSRLIARMLRDEQGGGKRADVLINATNDGWFVTPQLQQHLQLATFRCIENRVPAARSVNTGVSGFIDPLGRTSGLIGAGQTGTSTQRLTCDTRVTLYTRYGDLFAGACVIGAGGLVALGLWNGMKNRKSARR